VYEYEKNKEWIPSSIDQMIESIKSLGLKRVYANRWISASIGNVLGDPIFTVKPFNARYPNTPGTDRIIQWDKKVGFFVLPEDEPEVEQISEEMGLELKKKEFPDYVLFWHESDRKLAACFPQGEGLLWSGFSPIWTSSEAKGYFFYSRGKKEMLLNNTDAAVGFFKKAYEVSPNNILYLKSLKEAYQKTGNLEKVSEINHAIKEQFVPEKKVQAKFAEEIDFEGLNGVSDSVVPGKIINLRLLWILKEAIEPGIIEFLHFEGPEKHTFQFDRNFLQGKNTEKKPLKGTVFREDWEIKIPENTKSGVYRIAMGLWRPEKQKRLSVKSDTHKIDSDRIILGEIIIE